MFRLIFLSLVLFLCVLIQGGRISPCRAAGDVPDAGESIDFTAFTLEELKNVEVVSASKKPERISDIPAAVFVITREDIRRSGVGSIPEALRLAPGVQVARIGPTDWAVTVRGLNQEFDDNLLVLIDGRSVYTPVFSGVNWDTQDAVLEDIERIEVIRGPGASVWGANAVNGVINIITRNSKDTPGGQAIAAVGDYGGSGSLRYGGALAENTHYRLYAKYFNRDNFSESEEERPEDDWESARAGFRVDMNPGDSGSDTLVFQGEMHENQYDTDVYKIFAASPYLEFWEDTARVSGAHLMGRWQRRFSETSDMAFQTYYDRAENDYQNATSCVRTFDSDFRHRFSPFSGHELVWGLGYRFIRDEFFVKKGIDFFQVEMDPPSLEQHLASAFVQDKIRLVPDRLTLILGSRFEHNDRTGLEIQPNIRVLWTPEGRHALWGAVSRAVRTPSRIERDMKMMIKVFYPGHDKMEEIVGAELEEEAIRGAPVISALLGDRGVDSETLIAYELGWRMRLADTFWLDMAAFYNRYDKLIFYEPEPLRLENDPTPHYLLPLRYGNRMDGDACGFELAADWQLSRHWRVTGAYTYLSTDLDWRSESSEDVEADFEGGDSPRHQLSLRSSMDMSENLTFDLWLRYVDRLAENDVDSYTTLDARVGWEFSENLEVSLTGQNLLEKEHLEFSQFEVERGVCLKLDWRF